MDSSMNDDIGYPTVFPWEVDPTSSPYSATPNLGPPTTIIQDLRNGVLTVHNSTIANRIMPAQPNSAHGVHSAMLEPSTNKSANLNTPNSSHDNVLSPNTHDYDKGYDALLNLFSDEDTDELTFPFPTDDALPQPTSGSEIIGPMADPFNPADGISMNDVQVPAPIQPLDPATANYRAAPYVPYPPPMYGPPPMTYNGFARGPGPIRGHPTGPVRRRKERKNRVDETAIDANDPVAVKRSKNTLAARRSREKRDAREAELERRVYELSELVEHWKEKAYASGYRD